MMLDIKKTSRGFHKIPHSSKLQQTSGSGAAVATTGSGSGTGLGTGSGSGQGATESAGTGTGAGTVSGGTASGRGSILRLKGSKTTGVSGGVGGGGPSSVTGGRTHAALAQAKYGVLRTGSGAAPPIIAGNPVRAANQRYFLVSSYKDPTFLKAECDLAHAQVTASKAAKGSSSKRSRAGEDSRNNNPGAGGSGGGGSNRGVGAVGAVTLTDMRRTTPMFNGNQQQGGNSSSSSSTNTSTSTITSTTNHLLKLGARSAGGATASVQHQGKLHKLKPIQNNNGHAMNGHSNNNNNAALNNNMQRHQLQSKDPKDLKDRDQRDQPTQHDDISYIDSDEPQPQPQQQPQQQAQQQAVVGSKVSICYFKPITPPQLRGQRGEGQPECSGKQQRFGRPKSTIISSGHSNFAASYEKFNNYRQTNGDAHTSDAHNRTASNAKRYGIDSLSIKASIEKFNNLSGQKRQTPQLGSATAAGSGVGAGMVHSGVSTVSGSATSTTANRSNHTIGSSGNLQHRYSSDLDNIRVAAGYSSSLTRAAYRTTASVSTASSALGQIGGKLGMRVQSQGQGQNGRHPYQQECDKVNHDEGGPDTPTTSSVSNTASSSSTSMSTSSTTTTTATTSTVTTSSSATATTTTASPASASVSVSANSSGDSTTARIATGSSTSARSVLPPVSPTSSRYWDRDSATSRSSVSTSSTLNSSSLKHNSDDGYKSASSSRDEKSEGLCGLRNIGNTCFMNSVIQCLSHTQELTRFLRSYHGSRSSSTKDQQILHEFAKLIQEMWMLNVHTVTPMELKRAFSTKHRMYSDYNQQDAQEFLRFFLDSLHSALNTGVKGETLNIDDNLRWVEDLSGSGNPQSNPLLCSSCSDNKKADLTWEWYTRHENSLVRDLFVGQLKSTLKCTNCGNTSVTFDPFWDLSVPLPSSSRCKLDACLDLFIREEVLDGDEMPTCAKCKTRRKCTKSFTIQRFPKYLVIHLKRFSETRWSKLSNIVEFPTGDRELNMGSYGANSNSNVHYSLYAISNHMGSTAGGHYVALCKHPVSRKWHEFNDNHVSDALSDNFLVSSSAYILFYERA
ncbi:hypothetical protein KR009_002722 [Drosophila setifemur]|nr:hypothetical protein KR009_002722 [Drosophila setifemur]